MVDSGVVREITTEAELRDVLGFPAARVLTKDRTALHPRDRQWLAASPFWSASSRSSSTA